MKKETPKPAPERMPSVGQWQILVLNFLFQPQLPGNKIIHFCLICRNLFKYRDYVI